VAEKTSKPTNSVKSPSSPIACPLVARNGGELRKFPGQLERSLAVTKIVLVVMSYHEHYIGLLDLHFQNSWLILG